MFVSIVEVMFFVPDRQQAAQWYSRLLDLPITYLDNPEHFYIRVGSQDIWFHGLDDKIASGTAGQVAYWLVIDIDAAMGRAEAFGASLYRGPLDRKDGEFMCQMKDPFGNLFGLVGPKKKV